MQTVYISGLGEKYFDNAKTGMDSIRHIFEEKLSASIASATEDRHWKGFPLMVTGNRFFTKQSLVPHETLHSFRPAIDPKGILLQQAQSSVDRLVHTEENKVRYYEGRETADTAARRDCRLGLTS